MPGQLFDQPLALSSTVHTLGPEVVVTVSGELDAASAPAVTAALVEAVSVARGKVIVDASAVTFVDAAGLRALRRQPVECGGPVALVVRAPSRPVRRLLELTDLDELVETSASSPRPQERLA